MPNSGWSGLSPARISYERWRIVRERVPDSASCPCSPVSWQIIRHAAERSKHGRAGNRIAGTDVRYRAGMTEYLPQALSASYGCCRTDALEGFTGNEAVICDVERHSNKMNNAAHRLPSPNALPD